MSVPDYQYQAMQEYAEYLIDIINQLPNADEIKDKPGYKKVYNRLLDATARWLRSRLREEERKNTG